jgi:hypothetical protein
VEETGVPEENQKKNRVKVFNATFNNISVILWQLNIGILLKS